MRALRAHRGWLHSRPPSASYRISSRTTWLKSARTLETVRTAKMSTREIIGCKQDSLYHERKEDFLGRLLAFLCLIAWGAWWTADWRKARPVAASGGLYFPGRVELYVPQFFQSDPRWGEDALGATPGRLAAEGCAVASAAMALASYGVDVDPGRLNKFLTTLPGGYTPQGWIYWEKAAEFDSGFTSRLSAPLRGFALSFPD